MMTSSDADLRVSGDKQQAITHFGHPGRSNSPYCQEGVERHAFRRSSALCQMPANEALATEASDVVAVSRRASSQSECWPG